jgi:hypothetical protein
VSALLIMHGKTGRCARAGSRSDMGAVSMLPHAEHATWRAADLLVSEDLRVHPRAVLQPARFRGPCGAAQSTLQGDKTQFHQGRKLLLPFRWPVRVQNRWAADLPNLDHLRGLLFGLHHRDLLYHGRCTTTKGSVTNTTQPTHMSARVPGVCSGSGSGSATAGAGASAAGAGAVKQTIHGQTCT